MGGKAVWLVDLDGTLCDDRHRQHYLTTEPKDWNSYFDACHLDKPYQHILELIIVIGRSYRVLFATGRPFRILGKTERWLRQYGLTDRLFMRADGDFRSARDVKSSMVDQILAEGFTIIGALDDQKAVVEMYRSRGIPCLQVADNGY